MVKETRAQRQVYDIVIAGGGMAGLSTALVLAQQSPKLRILIVDPQPLKAGAPLYQPSFDARSTAISADSVDILISVRAWAGIVEHAAPIHEVSVSDQGHLGKVSYCSADNRGKPLGYVVENAWMGESLTAALAQFDNIVVQDAAQVSALKFCRDAVELELARADKTCERLSSRLLIIADGAKSGLRDQLGIHVDIHDYGQSALIANIETQKPHAGRAFERFTKSGPLALLPLASSTPSGSRSALVWTHPSSRIREVQALDEAECIALLQESFGYRLGKITRIGQRFAYPLEKRIAREQVRSRLVLMGNAAHYLHPVAGQGFNLALRDAESLAAVIREALHRGQDFASLAVLQRYQLAQRGDQLSTVGASHLFNRLFSSSRKSAQAVRNLGLMGMNVLPQAKHAFFAQMMGRGKKALPRL